jgi:hypothetical protein
MSSEMPPSLHSFSGMVDVAQQMNLLRPIRVHRPHGGSITASGVSNGGPQWFGSVMGISRAGSCLSGYEVAATIPRALQ